MTLTLDFCVTLNHQPPDCLAAQLQLCLLTSHVVEFISDTLESTLENVNRRLSSDMIHFLDKI